MHHIGEYKTAVNTFTEKGYTPAHREMDESLNRDLYEQIVRGIAEARKKTDADVRALIDEGPFLPEDALRAGLVDEVAYEDQVDGEAARRRARQRHGSTSTRTTTARVSLPSLGLNRGPRVAVIYAVGRDHRRQERLRSAERRRRSAPRRSSTPSAQARSDTSVRAIVLRIDSPGGSATASDAIWRELMIARDEKRRSSARSSSMSDLAASGGYYIAMPAQVIVAQPSTLTGSIGIFGGKFVTGGVYEKLGAHIESTSIGQHAEMNSPARPYNADGAEEGAGAAAVRSTTSSSRRWPSRGTARPRRSTRSRRAGSGPGGRRRRTVWSTSSAAWIARSRSPSSARRFRPTATWSWSIFPRPKSFYEMLSASSSRASDAISGRRRVDVDELSAGEARGAARCCAARAAMFRRGEPLALMPFTFVR